MKTLMTSVLAILLLLSPTVFPTVWSAPFPPGTVLISRNTDERENRSPGYWNHLALYVGNLEVIESQEGLGVIRTPTQQFLDRSYSKIQAFVPRDEGTAVLAIRRAERLVGIRYAPMSSLLPFNRGIIGGGMNCVSPIETACMIRGLNIPDNMFHYGNLFFPPEKIRDDPDMGGSVGTIGLLEFGPRRPLRPVFVIRSNLGVRFP